eukprot:764468-Hanusia_phi.AAC.1
MKEQERCHEIVARHADSSLQHRKHPYNMRIRHESAVKRCSLPTGKKRIDGKIIRTSPCMVTPVDPRPLQTLSTSLQTSLSS